MRLIALIAVPLALAGCVSNQTAAPPGATRPPGGPNLAAEDICVKAVQQATNAASVGVLSSELAPPSTLVMLDFPAAQAPWRCLVAPDGRVTEVKPVTG